MSQILRKKRVLLVSTLVTTLMLQAQISSAQSSAIYDDVQTLYLRYHEIRNNNCNQVRSLIAYLDYYQYESTQVPVDQASSVRYPTPVANPTIADLVQDRIVRLKMYFESCFAPQPGSQNPVNSGPVSAEPVLHGVFQLRSVNFPNRYIRHRNFKVELAQISSSRDLDDATFRMVSGLAGGDSISFEAVNFPNHYLRHQGIFLELHQIIDSDLFRLDASFYERRPGLTGATGSSFEAVNYPGHFIRHQNFVLKLDQNDGSSLFRQDATFYTLDGWNESVQF